MYRSQRFWRALVALVVVVPLGCSDPYVVRTMRHDHESTRFAVDSLANREASGPERLRSTLAILGRQWKKDAEDTPGNLAGFEAYFRDDVDDWPRHEADIRQELRRQVDGDLETIRRTLPRLVF